MTFSQNKMMSALFLIAIMLIALLFSGYTVEGFHEGASQRKKTELKMINNINKNINSKH
uniref:Uncharacterized protein n=1 Tax=viral metagenome TaxID=1070528 RepID=A0A6C0B682_9ZZZZ